MSQSRNWASPVGEFSRQAVIFRARWSCYLHILFTLRNWQNSDVEALCLWKNFCSRKKQKQKKDLGIKRGKKKQALRRKISASKKTSKCASQHILRFFHFCHGFFLWRWQLCPLLCRPPQRSTERSRWKNVSAKDHFSREILIHRHARRSRCPIGLRFREAR